MPPRSLASHLSLATDLYQLTMAAGYHHRGAADRQAIFHLFFRKAPFGGRFAIASGLARAVEILEDFRFDEAELSYLRSLKASNGAPLFRESFLEDLANLRLSVNVDAVLEGTVVFPHEPMMRVEGSLLQAQLVETILLNVLNFETLVATKAARIKLAAGDDEVLEFGLRRAQGPDGGLSASRAAYLGGCDATSNVLAGQLFGIPVRGTHAHSWVMAHDDEEGAFEAYVDAMPDNAVLLVDTYDTLEGVERAIAVGRRLRERGHELLGIRLDSGDLAALSIEARARLDAAGFPRARVVASNDLDEHRVVALKDAGARIDVWGIGTKLVTAHDQPALGGVYKLGAIEAADGTWQPRLKCSNDDVKTSIPGRLQVRRFLDAEGRFVGDMILDELGATDTLTEQVLIGQPDERLPVPGAAEHLDLLEPVLRGGKVVRDMESLEEARERARDQLSRLPLAHRRLENPEAYPTGLEGGLADRREALRVAARRGQA